MTSDPTLRPPPMSKPIIPSIRAAIGRMQAENIRPSATMRKDSTPHMPPFMVSAPGKVIVYGEHAVVYGKAAIAAAISLRSYLLVTFRSKEKRTVTLTFPDIGFEHTWDIPSLPWKEFSTPSKKKLYHDTVNALDPELLNILKPHLSQISPHLPEARRKIHQNSALAFLYLYLSLSSESALACTYTLRSTIPIGAGLGSSGSIAVCLSTALLLQARVLSGPHSDQPADEAKIQLDRINKWAFVAECTTHGCPSGVDNTVSAGGKAVMFRRTDYSRPPKVARLNNFPELPLLLVNTRQTRSTSAEVSKVAALKEAHPILVDGILDAIDRVTLSAHSLIKEYENAAIQRTDSVSPALDSDSDDFAPNVDVAYRIGQDERALKHLGELITVNHGLLVALGTSHPKLERIRELIDHAGIGWTKLTGAGGGGCAITIIKPPSMQPRDSLPSAGNGSSTRARSKSTVLTSLEYQLNREGFESFTVTLGGDGVGVLWPATLHNGNGEEGGEDIDQEKFLRAEGTEGIERLVGVECAFPAQELDAGRFPSAGIVAGATQTRSAREGWKFWRY